MTVGSTEVTRSAGAGFAGTGAGNVTAVVFDVCETLVDETRNWERVADECGVPRFTLMALIGVAAERGERPHRALEWLGVRPSRGAFLHDEFYPDAVGSALAAGVVAVHIRRGPWGYMVEPPAAALRIRSLDELPAVLA